MIVQAQEAQEATGDLVFTVSGGIEVIRCKANGDIHVRGQNVANDLEVVDALRCVAREFWGTSKSQISDTDLAYLRREAYVYSAPAWMRRLVDVVDAERAARVRAEKELESLKSESLKSER